MWPPRTWRIRAALDYWRRQLTLISPRPTLQAIAGHLNSRRAGAYLRFGEGDVRLALGASDVLQPPSPQLADELQEAFNIHGSGAFKAFRLECRALGRSPGMRPGLFAVPEAEAFQRLLHAGPCFANRPVYSHAALAYLSIVEPALAADFLAFLKSFRPIFVGNEQVPPELVARLFGGPHVPAPPRDAYAAIDRIESETWQALGVDYPVVVLAMGCAGRALAKRMMSREDWKGFVFDFGSLIDALCGEPAWDWIKNAPHDPRRILEHDWPGAGTRLTYLPPDPSAAHPSPDSAGVRHALHSHRDSSPSLTVRWEGPQLAMYSFSLINRELCLRLAQNKRIELSILPRDIPFAPDVFDPIHDPRFANIVRCVNRPLSHPAEVHVRYHVPGRYRPPPEGHWVIIQPWDLGSLPVKWVEWMNAQVDEVWVPSHYVRECFIRSRVEADRVYVVPNGVQVDKLRPGAPPLRLKTKKRFKFLFVGATTWRKGFDILLEAYGRAFTAADDVCLVIKGSRGFWGKTAADLLAQFSTRPRAPEIEFVDRALTDSELAGLYTACDCLAHPYRAEGFALTIAEAMASGLPAIVTRHGAALDYCSEATTFFIPAQEARRDVKRVVRLETVDYPWWAEPDRDALTQLMRQVHGNSAEARARGRAASKAVRGGFTWERSARMVVERMEALRQQPIRRFFNG